MHQSALHFGKAFFDTYLFRIAPSALTIVDVGSQDVNGSLRQFAPPGSRYLGVGLAPGAGVDIVLTDPYSLPFETGSVDAVVCSSVFAHCDFFWLLFMECLRIVKPDGLLYLSAPSNGMVHRYPIDGWRFYPDAGHALVNWARRQGQPALLLESFVAPVPAPADGEAMRNDFIAVFMKDELHASRHTGRIMDGVPAAEYGYARDRSVASATGGARPAMLQSTSWRLTVPGRMLGNQLERLRNASRFLPVMLRHGGGSRATAAKVLRIYRNEGLEGIKRRLIGIRLGATSAPVKLEDGKWVDRNDYQEWVRRYSTIDDVQRARIGDQVGAMKAPPLISVVMPAFNPKPQWLREAIESVQKQLYPHWELCIADDASTDPAIRPLLERFAAEDSRIKVVFREKNGHISAASNSALELASGKWVALLDHDDLLSEDALFRVAQLVRTRPDVRMVYSDEDKIDGNGTRHGAYFKCDWNPDLFHSQNMFCHLGVYDRELVRSVGGFRLGLEGAQDYDLALRCIEQINPDQIAHIPRVLYHWRVHGESTASGTDAKPYAVVAGERALNDHFQRTGLKGEVKALAFGYRACYELPAPAPLVSLLIPTKDRKAITEVAVRSILELTTYTNYEIIILDNGSVELETLDWFERIQREDGRVRVVRDARPFNFSAINNFGVTQASGSIIGLVNNDVEVIAPGWLSEMVSHAVRKDIGCVGAKLYYPNDTLQHGGVILEIGDIAGHSHKHFPRGVPGYLGRAVLTQNFSAVTAACLLVRKEIFDAVGGLDEENLRVAFNDVDFCLKVREAGYRNLWTPYAELYHHESVSRGAEDTPEKQARYHQEAQFMKKKWGQKLIRDPYYSPNLSLNCEDFSLAWPPRVELI